MKASVTVWSLCTAVLVAGTALAGCDRIGGRDAPSMPPTGAVAEVYDRHGMRGTIAIDGGTVEFTAVQDPDQLRRGGTLWARVGPYIYLFTPATREIFDTWDSVEAVRVVTRTPSDAEVARATLGRNRLSDVLWRRSLNILGRALQEGTERPRILEDLVRWGEQYTDYVYDPEYVPRR